MKNMYCKFSKSVGHDENNYQAYEIMMECGANTFRMQVEEHGHEENGKRGGRGGYKGK